MNNATPSTSSDLYIDKLTMSYTSEGVKSIVLNKLSLRLELGQFLAIVGPSGCGKSTLLNAVAGYLKFDSGNIIINKISVNAPSLLVGFVSQGYSLFEWLTVEENIAFGLKSKHVPDAARREIITHILKVTELYQFKNFYPAQLSGGMQQRVALARSIAPNPKVLLLDEPFSALDTDIRIKMHSLLLRLWDDHKTTILFVTHDIEEASLLADKILLLRKDTFATHIMDVPFPRPRPDSMKHTNDFRQFVEDILTYYKHT